MKKWYQKPIAIATAAACLLAGGAIGFSRDSLPQLHVTAEAANTYIGAAYGLQLEYEELEDGTVEITKFVSSTSTDIELPSVIDGKSVTGIAGSAFDANDIEACSNLTSIVIPNNVVSIGDYAFRGCTSLTDVMIPDSVISIGDSAFKGCTSLTNITIPDSVISIGDSVFEGCTSLISVTISDSVISMGDFVFYNCTRLTDVTISNSVTSIGISSFYNCTSLTTITIPNRVTSIKDHAFYNCTSLTDITIPDGVTSIRDNAFCDCDNLTDIYYKGTEAKWNQISIGSSAISSDVTIHYASTTSTLGSLEINKVEVTLDELQANDYEVTVPVTINNNDDGWDALAFGLSWNTNEVTYSSNIRGNLLDDAYANQNIKIDSSGLQIAPSLGGAWVAYASEMSNNSPNYVVGDGAIINITFKVNANAQLGDIYYIDSVSKSFDGMSVPIIQHSPYVSTQLASQGYIKIVDSTATATTTATTNTITTTTTTKPITTTTTKPITTTIKPITTESTTIITTIPTTTTTTEKTTTSTTESTLGSLEINKVEVALDELQANNYLVTVPVTINNNDNGWDALSFGLSWNINEITYAGNSRGQVLINAYINNVEIVGSGLQISPDASCSWVSYAVMSDSNPNYVVGDGAIINVTFKVNENAQPGDIYYIDSLSNSPDGAYVPIIQHSPEVTQLVSQGGYIKIVDSTATTTTATTNTITTTTTTKPTTTTTKPITTTIKPITTIPTTTTTTEKTTTSTTESTLGSLEINKVEVALDELQANNYLVTVPVTINNNDNGWDALSFGLSWNINEITYAGNSRGQVLINAYINNVEIVGSGLQISPDASCSWVSYAVMSDSNPNYVVGDGAIINVTFKVNENAQPGDIYYIDSLSNSPDGAYVPIIQHSPEVTQLVSQGGYIKIVDSTATTTTATTNTITTTTTTKPTTTTTKPITTTTKPITTTASTTTTMESTTTTTITTVPIITTTTTTTTTEKEYTFTPGADNWGFLNSHSNFGYGNYFMLDSYYNKLVDGLDNLEKYSVDDLLESSWGGSCYGMAATSILAADGILIPSNWQDNATFLNDIDAPPSDEVKSLINYYMALQATDAIQYQTNSFLYLTEKEKLKILVNCLKDGSPTLLTFFGSYWGHAVVAYDLQYGTYSINGTAYNGKVLIYDNNDNTFDDNYCLYFNSSKGTWTIPEYDDAYQLGFITDYTSFINYHGYIDTSDIPIQSAADSFIATLQSNLLKSNYSLTKINLNQNKNTYTFSTTDPNEIRTFSDFSDSMEANNLKFAMKDASKGYALKLATTETVDLSMRYENSIFDVTGSNGNIAVFDPSGYVSLEGSDTTYNFNMIYNDGYHTTDWYSFQVDGNHVDAANMKQTENGYVLRADSLNNVTAQAYNDDATAKVTFSTDYTDVLLYEINEETIGVAVDTNGDGTYETTIAKSDDTSEDTIMYGDVNGNNLVEVSDAVEVLKYYARKAAGLNSVFSETPSENEAIFKLADVNKDGEITVQDAVLILTYYAKTASGGNPTWEELTSA